MSCGRGGKILDVGNQYIQRRVYVNASRHRDGGKGREGANNTTLSGLRLEYLHFSEACSLWKQRRGMEIESPAIVSARSTTSY